MLRFLFVLGLSTLSCVSWASGYPPDYTHQTVKLLHQGPVVFATVSSGIMNKIVVGYKRSGFLSQFNRESIEAVIIGDCANRGVETQKVTRLKIGREWNGTGYMSIPLHVSGHLPEECRFMSDWKLSVAFSDGVGNWDSRFGRNYDYSSEDSLAHAPNVIVFSTGDSGVEINQLAWRFITEQMRK